MQSINQRLNSWADNLAARNAQLVFNYIYDRLASQALNTAGLAISGAGAATAKIGATDCYGVAAGSLFKVAAATVLPALTGIACPQSQFNVAVFMVAPGGTVSVAGGTAAAALGSVVWPTIPEDNAIIGFLLIAPTTGPFVGGTSALDGTLANTVYINTMGAFDPTAQYTF